MVCLYATSYALYYIARGDSFLVSNSNDNEGEGLGGFYKKPGLQLLHPYIPR